jgi:hypothetical protein
MAPAYVTAALALLGAALIVVAIVYFAEPARLLPSFFFLDISRAATITTPLTE